MSKKTTLLSIFLSCLFSLILFISVGTAEEADNETTDTAAENTEPPTESSAPTTSPNISFTPSEEISEDLPVSFPADI